MILDFKGARLVATEQLEGKGAGPSPKKLDTAPHLSSDARLTLVMYLSI